ncbi:MAG: hypothetical protein HZA88_09535 [Verrucomicrobia bacterium]|nr:hypothetical protein [Verrucomicrobiota bacterium]
MNLRAALFAYAALLMVPCIALPDEGCCNSRTSRNPHQTPAPNSPSSKRPPGTASTIKRTKIDHVDDRIRSQLSLQFEALVPFTGFACFKFANHSSEIISLPGPALHQPPGRQIYLTSHERFLVQKGKDWKPLYGGHWGASRDFDVFPGSEVTLLVPVENALGSPLNERVAKVGFGKVYSHAFRYLINDEFVDASKPLANPPAEASNLKRIRAYDVDDATCSRLHLRYDTIIPYSGYALFTFENSSPHIIALHGYLDPPPGKQVYHPLCYDYFLQQGDGWKDLLFLGDVLGGEFDVYPGSKIVLIITLRDVLGYPNPNKVWKIRLGKIYSEPFRYALPK